eukprot:1140769-Pelagomonas_calceolata.AAC.4
MMMALANQPVWSQAPLCFSQVVLVGRCSYATLPLLPTITILRFQKSLLMCFVCLTSKGIITDAIHERPCHPYFQHLSVVCVQLGDTVEGSVDVHFM